MARRPGAHHCGTEAAMEVIDGKWKVSILWALDGATRRFGELRRILPGVTEKVLAASLRELERDEIVRRVAREAVPPHVEYSLTPLGVSLNGALAPLGAWGERNVLSRA